MRIPRRITVLALTALAILGCRDEPPKQPRMSEAMPDLPLPPLATFISRSGGEDAIQLTFRSTLPPDSMAVFYRQVLTSGEWSLVNDSRSREGEITLYAERGGKPPLWVTIRKDSTSSGSLLSLGGAVTRQPDPASPADTTRRS